MKQLSAVVLLVTCLAVAGCGGGPIPAGAGAGDGGPTGRSGPTGPTGLQGPSGSLGPVVPCDAGPAGSNGPTGASGPTEKPISPELLTCGELSAEAKRLGTTIYWAGPRKGYSYELRRTARGVFFVRYLPSGVPAGYPATTYLIVATYPRPNGYGALVKAAGATGGRAVAGPHGSLIYVPRSRPSMAYVAFRGIPAEAEVYDSRPAVTAEIVSSGAIQPVR